MESCLEHSLCCETIKMFINNRKLFHFPEWSDSLASCLKNQSNIIVFLIRYFRLNDKMFPIWWDRCETALSFYFLFEAYGRIHSTTELPILKDKFEWVTFVVEFFCFFFIKFENATREKNCITKSLMILGNIRRNLKQVYVHERTHFLNAVYAFRTFHLVKLNFALRHTDRQTDFLPSRALQETLVYFVLVNFNGEESINPQTRITACGVIESHLMNY